MTIFKRCDSTDEGFRNLVALLDADLAIRDGAEHTFYSQFNKIDMLNHVVVGYVDEIPTACGAIKEIQPGVMEVKRMYTLPESRGKGLATGILNELEGWAKEIQARKLVLETGKKQPEAIALYLKNHFRQIPNYGQYAGVENSLCFQKNLQ